VVSYQFGVATSFIGTVVEQFNTLVLHQRSDGLTQLQQPTFRAIDILQMALVGPDRYTQL